MEELDYSLWESYLLVCGVEGVLPSPKDYQVWLEERDEAMAEMDAELNHGRTE